jgi:hypothetical protein
MYRVLYLHWQKTEARDGAVRLGRMGFQVEVLSEIAAGARELIRKRPPDAVVINLSRLPSHGREIAVWFTETKSTNRIPVIFVDGEAIKIEVTRQRIPSATFCSWSELKSAIKTLCAVPVEERPAPVRVLASGPATAAGYSGTPLWKKLGIKPGAVVLLIKAPANLPELLSERPDGVTFRTSPSAGSDLTLWFPADQSELLKMVGRLATRVPANGLWICWPKKASGVSTDLNEELIRTEAIKSGLTDNKVCAVDPVYAGLRFARTRNS